MRNPGKRLAEWLDGLSSENIEEALRNAPARGKHWQVIDISASEE
jgi:hypothetical protein